MRLKGSFDTLRDHPGPRRGSSSSNGIRLKIRAGLIVDALAEKLDERLNHWKPETAAEVRERVAEVIELADHGILDIARSRAAEQEVLDLLDEPPSR
jgi:hypothetical protein